MSGDGALTVGVIELPTPTEAVVTEGAVHARPLQLQEVATRVTES